MADRYWVGDGGNWSDNTNHWASSSGGAPGASLPSSTDDVFWDSNSFTLTDQVVSMDTTAFGNNVCHSFNATGVTNNPNMSLTVDAQATDFAGDFIAPDPMIISATGVGAIGLNGGGVTQNCDFSGVTWTNFVNLDLFADGVSANFYGGFGTDLYELFTNSNCTLVFDPSGSYTVSALILNPNATITSSSPGTEFFITANTVFGGSLTGLSVTDCHALGAIPFDTSSYLSGEINNGGNNTNWLFPIPFSPVKTENINITEDILMELFPDFYSSYTVDFTADGSGNSLIFSPGGDTQAIIYGASLKKIILAPVNDDRPIVDFLSGTTDNGKEIFFRADTQTIQLQSDPEKYSNPTSLYTELERGTTMNVFVSFNDSQYYELDGEVKKDISILKFNSANADTIEPALTQTIQISYRDSSKQLCRLTQAAIEFIVTGIDHSE